jgi:hypothetical protein
MQSTGDIQTKSRRLLLLSRTVMGGAITKINQQFVLHSTNAVKRASRGKRSRRAAKFLPRWRSDQAPGLSSGPIESDNWPYELPAEAPPLPPAFIGHSDIPAMVQSSGQFIGGHDERATRDEDHETLACLDASGWRDAEHHRSGLSARMPLHAWSRPRLRP